MGTNFCNRERIYYYINLITSYMNKNIDYNIFQREFFKKFKSEDIVENNLYEILEKLFSDIDVCTSDENLLKEGGYYITESELRNCSNIALLKLNKLLNKSMGN